MNAAADRWARVAALFDAAVDKPPDEREAVVRASQESPDIQSEVLGLLATHDDAGEFLAGSAASTLEDAPALHHPVLRLGSDLGPYRIVRTLGQGGMGIVYEAEDTRLHRHVALKLLSPNLAGDARQRERLKHEARAAARLSHPGIAIIYALEEIDDQLVIVSEYLEGETLRAEMTRGPLGLERAVGAGTEIARALAAAHARGIVHRDLKPENVIRTKEGPLKILDFGLAQFEQSAREIVSLTLTEPGMVGGTPPYMAPEQLLGQGTDFRTDQFAFGVMLYEMATGRHPFGGRSLPSTIAHILASQPQPLDVSDAFPAALWPVIERCLQKSPAARFESTSELLANVEAARAELPARYGETSPKRPYGREGGPDAPDAPAFWWWQFHQLAAAVIYWAMIWPAWHVHRAIGRGGLFFFFATLAAVVISANLRLHLWFSSRVYPDTLATQRSDTAYWIRAADCAFVALLVAGGLMLPETMAGWAAVLISVGIGTAVAFLIIERATARAAFRE